MSRVQPPGEGGGWPGDATPLSHPFGFENANSGFGGHVLSAGLMKLSIVNGAFPKWLVNGPPGGPGVASLHVCESAARLTSFCFRQLYVLPAWLTCFVWVASAFDRPFTPSQPPYRLSKLWFSS